MHRNVILRDNGDRATQVVPFTVMAPGSANPLDLWKWMEVYEQKTGGSALAIAHNGNLSNGIMFPVERAYTGKEVDKSYVEQRAKWEPLYEVTQTKGDGEAHPFPLAQRRIRRLRDLGQGQPRRQHRQDRRNAGVRVCALGS